MAGRVLIIGTFKNQRIRDELYIHNYEVINHNLTSSPENWQIIIQNLKDNNNGYDKIILQITESVLLIARKGTYNDLFWEMIDLIKGYQHLVILYEDNISNKFNIFNKAFYKKYLYYEYLKTDKRKYDSLVYEHEAQLEELRKRARENFFYDYVVKYALIADDQEWETYYSGCVFTDEQNIILQNKREEYHHFQNRNINEEIDNEVPSEGSTVGETKWEYLCSIADDSDSDNINFMNIGEVKENIKKLVSKTRYYEYVYEDKYQVDHNEEIQTAKCQMAEIVADLRHKRLNITTYKMSTDLIYTLKDFLKSSDENIVFQRYFLRSQLYADELEKFLCLFEDYILHIKQIQIKVEHFRTAEGIVFIIRSNDEKIAKENFNNSVQNFAEFLNICDYDVDMAKSLLKRENSKIKDIELDFIIQKYSIEARRLKLDIRHEYERKVLDVKQRFENDILLGNEDLQIDEMIKEKTMSALPVLIQQYNAPIYINSGTVNYNENDVQLEELFKKYAETEEKYTELVQQLNMLKDKGIAREHREGAFDKIKRFLKSNSVEIAGQLVSILLEYITLLLG